MYQVFLLSGEPLARGYYKWHAPRKEKKDVKGRAKHKRTRGHDIVKSMSYSYRLVIILLYKCISTVKL